MANALPIPIECSEIVPNLYMGSRPPPGPWIMRNGFRALVLAACDFQPPSTSYPGVDIARIPLQDEENSLSPQQALVVTRLSRILSKRIRARDKVLVTCNQGRNRSGLVTALILTSLTGMSGLEAVLQVKAKRQSPWGLAFTNETFISYLMRIPAAA
jgi:hypothetical protein